MGPEREVTIYDIARHLAISASTVSRGLKNNPVINKQTRLKIQEAALQLGYRSNLFASSLRTRKTHTLGVIIPRINSHFMSSVLEGMGDAAGRLNYSLLFTYSDEKMEKEVLNTQLMFAKRVDGLLISLAYNTRSIDHLEPFFRKKIPVIFFDRCWQHSESMSLEIDNLNAAYETTKHLLMQGFRRIWHITGDLSKSVYIDRLNGYKQALKDFRVPYEEKRVIITPLSPEAGLKAAEKILHMNAKDRPDAVFASNDTAAVYCMLRLKEAGIRIPQDIGFAGFNNDPVSLLSSPQLTTTNYPGKLLGDLAVTNLVQHLNGFSDMKTTPRIILRSDLLIRESSLKKKTL